MPAPEQAFHYQFALFIHPKDPGEAVTLVADGVPELFNEPPPGVGSLGLRFRPKDMKQEQKLAANADGVAVAAQTFIWQSAASTWRLELTTGRLDIHFDARGYEEIREEEERTPMQDVVRRVAAPLSMVGHRLDRHVINRIGMVVKVQAEAPGIASVAAVSKSLFSDGVQESVRSGGTSELMARINQRTRWPLTLNSGRREVAINRIQTAESREDFDLTWQWDANTAPGGAHEGIAGEGIREFLHRAGEWIGEEVSKFEKA